MSSWRTMCEMIGQGSVYAGCSGVTAYRLYPSPSTREGSAGTRRSASRLEHLRYLAQAIASSLYPCRTVTSNARLLPPGFSCSAAAAAKSSSSTADSAIKAPARALDEVEVCRTRAYFILQRVRQGELPPDAALDCPRQERNLAKQLERRLEETGVILYSYNGTEKNTGVHRASLQAAGATWLIGLRPDYAAAVASEGRAAALVVEAACTSPEEALPRITPRLLLYKAWMDNCIGGNALAIYAPLVPGETPVLLSVTNPLRAWRCVEERLRQLHGIASAPEPPRPASNQNPPCSHCGYRSICPYTRARGGQP